MCVCICIYIYIYTFMYIYTYMHSHMFVLYSTQAELQTYMYIYICIHTYMYIYTCMHSNIHVCVFVWKPVKYWETWININYGKSSKIFQKICAHVGLLTSPHTDVRCISPARTSSIYVFGRTHAVVPHSRHKWRCPRGTDILLPVLRWCWCSRHNPILLHHLLLGPPFILLLLLFSKAAAREFCTKAQGGL